MIASAAMPDSFSTDLLRVIAAAQLSQLNLRVAQEMFGKGYFALGVHEKGVVDETAHRMMMGHFRALTPEAFGQQGPWAQAPDHKM